MASNADQNSYADSVLVSEDAQPSVASHLSDPRTRMRKIINMLKANSENKTPLNTEAVDYNEMVADHDLRYLLVADVTADLIRTQRASAIKSGYEAYESVERALNGVTPILLFLMGMFILFGRPEWCANLGTYINHACTHSLDPSNPVEYVVARTPMLSASTKTFICIASMTVIAAISLLNMAVTCLLYTSPSPRDS